MTRRRLSRGWAFVALWVFAAVSTAAGAQEDQVETETQAEPDASTEQEQGAQPTAAAQAEAGTTQEVEGVLAPVAPVAPQTTLATEVVAEAEAETEADDEEESLWEKWNVGDNFMDTVVTFTFSDDNVLAGAKDRSPNPGMQDQTDELFMEGLDQEKRGRETETQLVLYKRSPAFFKRMDAEAALVIEFQNWVNEKTFKNETVIGDDGSYLKLNYYTRSDDLHGDNVSLTLFPMDSQRFLLGYTYDIAWGGERIFPNNSGQVPGARLKYDWNVGTKKPGYAFLGAKTARLLNDAIHEPETYYGLLAGFGVSFTDFLTWETNGGYFQRGAFPSQGFVEGEVSSIGGKTVEAYGASTRLTLHIGAPIANSVDFRLYKPERQEVAIVPEKQIYDKDWALSVSGELTSVWQTLLEWDNPDSTTVQPAMAGAAIAKVRFGKVRLHVDYIYRQLSYVVLDIPGVSPYYAFPQQADITDEWFIAGGIDYYIEALHLTPGFIFGYKQPATWESEGVTTVIKSATDWEQLPPGQNSYDMLAAKLTLRWDVADFFSFLGEIRYLLDKNSTKYVKVDEGEAGRLRVFQEDNVTNQLGFSLLAQAKW